MSNQNVVITGVGPVTAIGCGRQVFWDSLISGKRGVNTITRCDTSRSVCKIGAEVKDLRLKDLSGSHRIVSGRFSRATEMAIVSASLAIEDAAIQTDFFNPERVGVFVGTSVANIGESFQIRDDWLNHQRLKRDASFLLFNHSTACLLTSLFDLRGPTLTISTGCNSGLDALGQATRIIQQGLVDAMLVVATDNDLVPEVMATLNASGSLSTRYNEDPQRAPRPFDVERDGVVPGEGAAGVWLESESMADARKALKYARVTGYASCAAGQSRVYSPEPNGDLGPSMRALRGVMAESEWQPKDVDLFNANGSGSISYDRLEAQATAKVFGTEFERLPVHSIKSAIGLPGGAASGLQVIASCLSIQNSTIPPTVNHEKVDPACGPIRVVTETESCRIHRVLVHSIGLGGFYYSSGSFCYAD